MNPSYQDVSVSFDGSEYKLLKRLFSYLPCLFRSNLSEVQNLINENENVLSNDLIIVLETLCDLYSLDSTNNNAYLSLIRQFRDM